MDDIPGWKGAAVCNNGFTNLERTFRDRFALDLKAARSLERACYSRTHPKMIIRRVHHGIHLRLADISALGFQGSLPDGNHHTLIIRPHKFC